VTRRLFRCEQWETSGRLTLKHVLGSSPCRSEGLTADCPYLRCVACGLAVRTRPDPVTRVDHLTTSHTYRSWRPFAFISQL